MRFKESRLLNEVMQKWCMMEANAKNSQMTNDNCSTLLVESSENNITKNTNHLIKFLSRWAVTNPKVPHFNANGCNVPTMATNALYRLTEWQTATLKVKQQKSSKNNNSPPTRTVSSNNVFTQKNTIYLNEQETALQCLSCQIRSSWPDCDWINYITVIIFATV